jgi:hypothetical protein
MRHAFTIRTATTADLRAIRRLAELDEGPAPRGETLLGFVDGELAAARPVGRGTAVADPFRHTAELLDLLALRARQERAA